MNRQRLFRYQDLEERTTIYSLSVISYVRKIKPDLVSRVLINQIVRSSTSVGANYREANAGTSKKEFIYRLKVSRKELRETAYWLELIASSYCPDKTTLKILQDETTQLQKIFSSMIYKIELKK